MYKCLVYCGVCALWFVHGPRAQATTTYYYWYGLWVGQRCCKFVGLQPMWFVCSPKPPEIKNVCAFSLENWQNLAFLAFFGPKMCPKNGHPGPNFTEVFIFSCFSNSRLSLGAVWADRKLRCAGMCPVFGRFGPFFALFWPLLGPECRPKMQILAQTPPKI